MSDTLFIIIKWQEIIGKTQTKMRKLCNKIVRKLVFLLLIILFLILFLQQTTHMILFILYIVRLKILGVFQKLLTEDFGNLKFSDFYKTKNPSGNY